MDLFRKGVYCYKYGRDDFHGNQLSLWNHVQGCKGASNPQQIKSKYSHSVNIKTREREWKIEKKIMDTGRHEDGTDIISFLCKKKKNTHNSSMESELSSSDESDALYEQFIEEPYQ